ncbi:unnamed protein product, partial [Prorocentrum cordatum]
RDEWEGVGVRCGASTPRLPSPSLPSPPSPPSLPVAHGGVLAQPVQIVPPPAESEYVSSDAVFGRGGASPAGGERWGESDPQPHPMDVLGSQLAGRQETPTFADVGASHGAAASADHEPEFAAGASHGAAASADHEPEFAAPSRQPPWARPAGRPAFPELSRAGDDLRSCAANWKSKDRENCTAFNAPLDALSQFLQQQQDQQKFR